MTIGTRRGHHGLGRHFTFLLKVERWIVDWLGLPSQIENYRNLQWLISLIHHAVPFCVILQACSLSASSRNTTRLQLYSGVGFFRVRVGPIACQCQGKKWFQLIRYTQLLTKGDSELIVHLYHRICIFQVPVIVQVEWTVFSGLYSHVRTNWTRRFRQKTDIFYWS